jgi:uncharacterized protein YbjT (DUF2867 family)
MYAITGITGKAGGVIARNLLADGQSVRAVLRDQAKRATWAAKGCDVAIAEMECAEQLSAAFSGARGVFVLPPSDFDPEPGYPEAKRVIDAVARALTTKGSYACRPSAQTPPTITCSRSAP